MMVALGLVNTGLLPVESPVYSVITSKLVPLAVPLLLLDADLVRVKRDGQKLLLPYCVACIGTIVGTLAGWPTLASIPLDDRATMATALAGRHIGGAVNYVAVTDAGNAPASLVAAGIAADNAVIAPYFALLFAITQAGASSEVEKEKTDVADVGDASTALAVALCCVAAASLAGKRTLLLPLCTLYTVMLASLAPRFCRKLAPAGRVLGNAAMQLFVAAIGAGGDLRSIFSAGKALFLFSVVQIGVHFGVVYLGGFKLLKFDLRALAASSNAAVGGPTTAAAMCASKRWDDLVLPSILVGILGYASGTFIALAMRAFFLGVSSPL